MNEFLKLYANDEDDNESDDDAIDARDSDDDVLRNDFDDSIMNEMDPFDTDDDEV